jgi:hypothetical protein
MDGKERKAIAEQTEHLLSLTELGRVLHGTATSDKLETALRVTLQHAIKADGLEAADTLIDDWVNRYSEEHPTEPEGDANIFESLILDFYGPSQQEIDANKKKAGLLNEALVYAAASEDTALDTNQKAYVLYAAALLIESLTHDERLAIAARLMEQIRKHIDYYKAMGQVEHVSAVLNAAYIAGIVDDSIFSEYGVDKVME